MQKSQIALSILFGTLLLSGFGWVTPAAAATPEVQFAATPLFLDADVKPGDSTARTVVVTNPTSASHAVFASVENTFDTGLAEVMRLTVASNGSTHFSGTFLEFFAATPLELGVVGPGASVTYTFTAALPTTTGNAYQLTSLGFDLVVGFVGGGSVTDTPTGRGGGGGGGGSFLLQNERVVVTDNDTGSAQLTWTTTRPATSYLVCGDTATDVFVLDAAAPRFGYQFVVPESTALTLSHTVDVTGLAPSTYECRPASRERLNDDFTVGIPLRFTITPPPGVVLGEAATAEPIVGQVVTPRPLVLPTGSVLGVGTKGAFGGPTYDEWRAELEAERAARAAAEADSGDESSAVAAGDEEVTGYSGGDTNERTMPLSETGRQLSWLALAVLLFAGLLWYLRRSA